MFDQNALNDHLALEIESAYLYLAMSAWAESQAFPGCAHWMRKQWKEETDHAMKVFDYVIDRGGRVQLRGVPQPPADYASMTAVFEQSLAHERKVTAAIHSNYERAMAAKDHATAVFLQWFIAEQVEEERQAQGIVDMLARVGDKAQGLLMVDKRLAKRGMEV